MWFHSNPLIFVSSANKSNQDSQLFAHGNLLLYFFYDLCLNHEALNNLAVTRKIRSSVSPTRCDTNRPVRTWKQARSLKVSIYVEEELYYLYSKNKGADQLISGFVFAYAKSGFMTMRLINTEQTINVEFSADLSAVIH